MHGFYWYENINININFKKDCYRIIISLFNFNFYQLYAKLSSIIIVKIILKITIFGKQVKYSNSNILKLI